MQEFRLLQPDEISCRISEIHKEGKYVRLLLYKTARTDTVRLTEKFGHNWQIDYKDVGGTTYCGIGIKEDGEWIWRWNVGTESNVEAEKGKASDGQKRAGFLWGIGTELYSAPDITIFPRNGNVEIKTANGKASCYEKFKVVSISYDDAERISGLEIACERTGEVIYKYSSKASGSKKTAKTAVQQTPEQAQKFSELQDRVAEAFNDETEMEPLPWEDAETAAFNIILERARRTLAAVTNADGMNAAVEKIKTLQHVKNSKELTANYCRKKARELGLKLDRASGTYVS